MTRADFMRRLQLGLRQVPPDVAAGILLDYEGYFADGMRAGRTELDLALALGDPERLAAELRLDISARAWETSRNVTAGLQAARGVLSLALLDLVLLLPLCIAIILCAAGFIAAILIALAGCYVLVTSLFDDPVGGALAGLLQGVSLISGGIATTAALSLVCIGVFHALARYARLHRRVFKPLQVGTLVPSRGNS